jgi:hypothetical protein
LIALIANARRSVRLSPPAESSRSRKQIKTSRFDSAVYGSNP